MSRVGSGTKTSRPSPKTATVVVPGHGRWATPGTRRRARVSHSAIDNPPRWQCYYSIDRMARIHAVLTVRIDVRIITISIIIIIST